MPKNTIQSQSQRIPSSRGWCIAVNSTMHQKVTALCCKICCGALHCIFHIAVKSAVQFLREDSSKVNFFWGVSILIFLNTFFTARYSCLTLAEFHIKSPAIGLLSVPAPPQGSNTKPFSQKSKSYIWFLFISNTTQSS